jgi:glutaminase
MGSRRTNGAMRQLPIERFIQSVHEDCRGLTGGAPASYIPPLAEADPSWFGISLVTTDGHSYEIGESRRPFTIQSVSKAFVFGMALEDNGVEQVIQHVGVEPTGDPFNSISVEEDSKRPFNPMVNAGAIVTTSLLAGATPAEQYDRMLDGLSAFAGRPLSVDERVFQAEQASGDRNRAIAYFMRALDMGPADVGAALDLYFHQCSTLVDCRDLGVMAATLANRGVNPLTGQRALEEEQVVRVLSVMSTCGMYDFTGEWIFRVGMPAKSGVSGGIIAVVPGQLGIAVFSPPLDKRGNSVRGVAVCEQLSQRFGLHPNRTHLSGASVVRRRYSGGTARSKRQRATEEASALRAAGASTVVLELQGDLYFATAEVLSRTVAAELDTVDYLILDCRRVGHMDSGAMEVLAELIKLTEESGTEPVLVGTNRLFAGSVYRPMRIRSMRWFRDVDTALEWCEERILDSLKLPGDSSESTFADQELLIGLDADMLSLLDRIATRRHFPEGETVFSEGDPADGMYFIESGQVSVQLHRGGGSIRLASFGPGATFGEMSLLDEGQRSSTIVAEENTVCRVLSPEALASIANGAFSALSSILYRNLAKTLSWRLRESNEAIRSLE